MFTEIKIRRAVPEDVTILTDISFAAKRYWNYPGDYYDIWKNELTITPSYIVTNQVFIAQMEAKTIGFYSIVEVKEDFYAGKVCVKKGFWLEHLFIRPDYIKSGIGTRLVEHAKAHCKQNCIPCLYLFSDPNARGFYDKLGAVYLGESPSSIEGRTVSLYLLNLEERK